MRPIVIDNSDVILRPTNLEYPDNTLNLIKGETLSSQNPTVDGDVDSWEISPPLPTGLSFNTSNGHISGTPSVITASAEYTVRARNGGGCAIAVLTIVVITDVIAPSNFHYDDESPTYYLNVEAESNAASFDGDDPDTIEAVPPLPAGMSIDWPGTGEIYGTPTVTQAPTVHRITATNEGGSTYVDVTIGVEVPAAIGDLIFHAPFTSGLNAIVGAAPTGTAVGGAAVAAGYLDLTGNGVKSVSFPAANLAAIVDEFEVQMILKPNYTGNPPGGAQWFTSWGSAGKNGLLLGHNSQLDPLKVYINLTDKDAAEIITAIFDTFNPTAGTDVTLALTVKLSVNEAKFFINGSQVGSTMSVTGVLDNDTGPIVVGSDPSQGSPADFSVKSYKVFKAIQTT